MKCTFNVIKSGFSTKSNFKFCSNISFQLEMLSRDNKWSEKVKLILFSSHGCLSYFMIGNMEQKREKGREKEWNEKETLGGRLSEKKKQRDCDRRMGGKKKEERNSEREIVKKTVQDKER